MADYVFERMKTERDLRDLVEAVFRKHGKPNKAPEPTSGTVTPPAEPGGAPVPPVAHL
jgi:hypothetical protein